MGSYEALSLFLKFFARALMILLVMPLINSARGLVAKWMGDDTSEREGRITLNPMAHLDPLGSIMILLIGFGWSKPMPIVFSRMKNQRLGIVLVSLTGPLTHFLSAIILKIAIICINLWGSSSETSITPLSAFATVIFIISQINVCLGVINILPLPPMDGFVVLYQFAGRKFHSWYHANYEIINRVSTIILFALFFIGDLTRGIIDPLAYIIAFFDSCLDTISVLPFTLLALIGVLN